MSSKTIKGGLPTRQPKEKRAPGIIIDMECSEYAMIFPLHPNRPQKKARTIRSSKSKTPVPPVVEPPKIVKMDHASPAPISHALTSTTPTSRHGTFIRKKSEAFGVLNKMEKPAQSDDENDIKKPKRKRLVDEVEIAAENIPPKTAPPVFQFGIKKDKCPEGTRQPKGKRAPGIIIDTECSEYTMKFPLNPNRPQKKARRGRSTKSKTPVPPEVEPPKIVKMDHASPAPVSHALTSTPPPMSSRLGSFSRKKPEALGVLNKIEKPAQSVENVIKRPKRKRLVDEVEIAAENIPLEAVLPVLQFGINKDMCPRKRRRLQSLMSPRN